MGPAQTEEAMANRATHPCDRREALKPWKPDHLYIGDSGQVLCGRCMGVESTWMPWAWSDLGRMDAHREVKFPPDVAAGLGKDWPELSIREFRCETDPRSRLRS